MAFSSQGCIHDWLRIVAGTPHLPPSRSSGRTVRPAYVPASPRILDSSRVPVGDSYQVARSIGREVRNIAAATTRRQSANPEFTGVQLI